MTAPDLRSLSAHGVRADDPTTEAELTLEVDPDAHRARSVVVTLEDDTGEEQSIAMPPAAVASLGSKLRAVSSVGYDVTAGP